MKTNIHGNTNIESERARNQTKEEEERRGDKNVIYGSRKKIRRRKREYVGPKYHNEDRVRE